MFSIGTVSFSVQQSEKSEQNSSAYLLVRSCSVLITIVIRPCSRDIIFCTNHIQK